MGRVMRAPQRKGRPQCQVDAEVRTMRTECAGHLEEEKMVSTLKSKAAFKDKSYTLTYSNIKSKNGTF